MQDVIDMNEYRINLKGSLQGHYIVAKNLREATKIANRVYPFELYEIHLWKIQEKGHSYPNKLSPYARRKMKLGR